MSTTSELAKWLLMVADSDAASSYTNRAEHMRAAAARLAELEAEVARLREALEPFASDTIWLHRDRITDDDLRNARAALEERKP